MKTKSNNGFAIGMIFAIALLLLATQLSAQVVTVQSVNPYCKCLSSSVTGCPSNPLELDACKCTSQATVSVLSPYTLVPEEHTIQPGAFDPVTFTENLSLSNNNWVMCGASAPSESIYSQPCETAFYACNTIASPGYAPPHSVVTTLGSTPNYISSYCNSRPASCTGYCPTVRYPCAQSSSSPSAGSSVFAYTSGVETSGPQDLCFYEYIDTVGTFNYPSPYTGAEVECDYYAYGWSGANANYIVSPYTPANENVINVDSAVTGVLNGNYFLETPTGQPTTLLLSVNDMYGNPTHDIVWPESATFNIIGNVIVKEVDTSSGPTYTALGYYPLYMELTGPGADACVAGGSPRSYGPVWYNNLPACGADPSSASLPCGISYSRNPSNGKPTSAVYNVSSIGTSDLGPGVYTVCGYEGDYPSNMEDPAQIFFTESSFTLTCPPYDPTCSVSAGATAPPPLSISSVQAEACSLYLSINQVLIILAISLMLIGAIIYSTATTLPGQMRGMMQAYGFGLVIAGVVSLIIAVISIYLLGLVSGYNVPYVLYTLNSCPTS